MIEFNLSTLCLQYLVTPRQPIDLTHDDLRSYFNRYGAIKDISIPKDHSTGRSKGFAFIDFYSEEDAKAALIECEGKAVFSSQVRVSYAHKHPARSRQTDRSSSHRRSRSRSQSNTTSVSSDLRRKIEAVTKDNKSTQLKISEVQAEIEASKAKLSEAKDEFSRITTELSNFETAGQIFLPCGHLKTLKRNDIEFLDGIYETAVLQLSDTERKNERLLLKLRSKIFYKVEQKRPEIYKCRQEEPWTLSECGHKVQAECCEIRLHEKGVKVIACSVCSSRV
jgi:hypothetical protein